MGRFLPILIIVAICLIVCNKVRQNRLAATQTRSAATGLPMATPTPSIRPDIEAACQQNKCELISFKPTGVDQYEFVVRGKTAIAVANVLDTIGPPPQGSGIMKDLVNYDDPKRYWKDIYQSNEAHYARHVIRAWK